jgi:cation diffusion facilitator CzcD-associated flavoprotein CzcO
VNTVVVGASAAGLSAAHCLEKAGVEHVLLERQTQVATAWRNHYDRLHLHTTKALSELPDQHWPAEVESYPARADVVAYLERYAARLAHPPRFGQNVRRIERHAHGWRTQTDDHEYLSQNVVIATGYARTPYVPAWPGLELYRGDCMHSSSYKNGDAWRGKRVLVVGFGNSACEIAIDLHERGAKPAIAVRGKVNVVPRDVFGIPILAIGISMVALPPQVADVLAWPMLQAMVGDLRKLGLQKLPYGPNVQIQKHGRIPLLDIGTVALIKKGALEVRPGVERFTESGVVFSNGEHEDFAAVVLGTGYRPALSDFLVDADALCTHEGAPKQSGAELLPGLYFCGFYVSPTGMLREIAIEAKRIASSIAGKHS